MKKLLFFVLVICFSVLMFSCGPDSASVDFRAAAVSQSTTKSIDMGNGVIVNEYNVVFYKVEVGNSEDDKFVLWENADGVSNNLVNPVDFDNEKVMDIGNYNFCRITIGKTINLVGSDDGNVGEANVEVTGNFDSTDNGEVFLFGTDDAPGNPQGDFLLTETIGIVENTTLTMTVNINGTVAGDGAGNITLSEPSITFEAVTSD